MIRSTSARKRLTSTVLQKSDGAIFSVSGFIIVWDTAAFFKTREGHLDSASTVIRWADVTYSDCDKVLCLHLFFWLGLGEG